MASINLGLTAELFGLIFPSRSKAGASANGHMPIDPRTPDFFTTSGETRVGRRSPSPACQATIREIDTDMWIVPAGQNQRVVPIRPGQHRLGLPSRITRPSGRPLSRDWTRAKAGAFLIQRARNNSLIDQFLPGFPLLRFQILLYMLYL